MRKLNIVTGLLAAIAMLVSSPIRAAGTFPANLHLLTAVEIKALLADVAWQFIPTAMDAPSEYIFHPDGSFERGGGRPAHASGRVAISRGQFCLVIDPKYPGQCWQVLRDDQHHIYFAAVHRGKVDAPVLVTLKNIRR